MKEHSPLPCADAQLLDLIGDRLSGKHLDAMLLHIENCDRCRVRMDELSAESHHWTKTTSALSSGVGTQVTSGRHDDKVNRTSPEYSPSDATLALSGQSAESIARQLLLPPSHPEMLGRLGRYEVERLIGSGGMGVVFKAFDTELNRPVAIKLLAPHLASCGSARQRFAREARAAAAVVNEHVVPIHNVETNGETPFLVMKYIDGESLQARLDRDGPLQLEEILRIGMQVAAGLAAAHQQGLVHRDIKPANILLEQGLERALITDFGLARAADDANLTHSGFHLGTPSYMSPEQVAGRGVDCRSDLFSLGSVIYAMCTGRPPFRAENSFGVMRRITEDTPRSIQEVNPRIPGWLDSIVFKLLTKCPSLRPLTAPEASQLLAQCLKHVQHGSSNPLPPAVVSWMNETSAAPSTSMRSLPGSKIAGAVLHYRRRFVVAGILTFAAGAFAIANRWPSKRSDDQKSTEIHSADQSELAKPDSKGNPLSSGVVADQANAPELEWDAAINQTRALHRQAMELELKLNEELAR